MEISARSISGIKKVLLDPSVSGPKHTYFMVRDLPFFSSKNIRCDLTIIPPYRLGKEFNKTFGHIHKENESETYKILLGKALFVLQKIEDENRVSEIQILRAKKGSRITIPGDYYHGTVNRGRTPLVLINWLSRNTQNDYSLIEEKQGFGYYVVANSGGEEFRLVKNENYKEVPKAEVIQIQSSNVKQNPKSK